MPLTPLPITRVYLAQTISEPTFGSTAEFVFYVKLADGKRSIIRQSTTTGLAETLTTEPKPRGGIGYGGAIFTVMGTTLVYAAEDGRLYGIDLETGEQWAITPTYEGVAAPALSPRGKFVAFLCEQDRACNVLLTEAHGKSLPVKLSDDPWYAFNPAFSPDGARIAWQEWNEMDMPWEQARLQIARFARPARDCTRSVQLLPISITTIARSRTSYASPQFSLDGKSLAFTSDETGWRSLWVSDASGANPIRVETGAGEIGRPDWVPGLVSMRWSEDGKSLFTVRRYRSQDTLLRVAWPGKKVTEIETDWTEIEGLNIGGERLVFIGANPAEPPTLVTLDLKGGREQGRATNAVGLVNPAALSKPQVIHWNTVDDATAWGVFYPAVASGGERRPRPIIVYVHGGPTSERAVSWDAQAQYFATRGWHYLIVNHRGSTGYGREYQDALKGKWGVLDIQDACTGAIHLINSGLANPKRAVITGGSAGGYTTLMALTQQADFWAGGVSLYGIGNMYDLKLGSHRFEVNYEQWLIGKLPETGPLWKERSPLTHVKIVRAPVLLFHGTDDKAVPHQQSVEFADAVRRNGGIAELVSYPGEGHGFVMEATRRDMIEKMERFLDKYVLCLQK